MGQTGMGGYTVPVEFENGWVSLPRDFRGPPIRLEPLK